VGHFLWSVRALVGYAVMSDKLGASLEVG
jgi:hypothetical protein